MSRRNQTFQITGDNVNFNTVRGNEPIITSEVAGGLVFDCPVKFNEDVNLSSASITLDTGEFVLQDGGDVTIAGELDIGDHIVINGSGNGNIGTAGTMSGANVNATTRIRQGTEVGVLFTEPNLLIINSDRNRAGVGSTTGQQVAIVTNQASNQNIDFNCNRYYSTSLNFYDGYSVNNTPNGYIACTGGGIMNILSVGSMAINSSTITPPGAGVRIALNIGENGVLTTSAVTFTGSHFYKLHSSPGTLFDGALMELVTESGKTVARVCSTASSTSCIGVYVESFTSEITDSIYNVVATEASPVCQVYAVGDSLERNADGSRRGGFAVTDVGGALSIGSYLVASNYPGHVMLSPNGSTKTSAVIGKLLEVPTLNTSGRATGVYGIFA